MRELSLVWTSETVVGDPERKITVVAFMSQTKTQACWQSPSVYSHLLKMDMAGLAWEWLRRTQQYYLIYKSQTHLEQNRIIGDPIALRGVATDTAVLAGLHFL